MTTGNLESRTPLTRWVCRRSGRAHRSARRRRYRTNVRKMRRSRRPGQVKPMFRSTSPTLDHFGSPSAPRWAFARASINAAARPVTEISALSVTRCRTAPPSRSGPATIAHDRGSFLSSSRRAAHSKWAWSSCAADDPSGAAAAPEPRGQRAPPPIRAATRSASPVPVMNASSVALRRTFLAVADKRPIFHPIHRVSSAHPRCHQFLARSAGLNSGARRDCPSLGHQ